MDMLSLKQTWLKSLSLKVLLAYVIGVVVSIVLISTAIFWLIFYQLSYLASNDVRQLTQEMAKDLQFDGKQNPIGFNADGDDFDWIFESLKQEAAYRVMDETGRTVYASPAGVEFWPISTSIADLSNEDFDFKRNDILFHSSVASTVHQERQWYVQFAVSERFFYFMHRGFALPFMGVGIVIFSLVLLCVFGACAYFTLSRTLKPLRKASQAAAKISPRSLQNRLPTEAMPSEIMPLIDNFNLVLDRLEKGFRIQQEFLATAAHELKTPLALIKAQAEMQPVSSDRDAILNDVNHMARQVQQLLILAEVSEFQNYHFDMIDLNEVVDEALSYLLPMSKAADVDVVALHVQRVIWFADRSALFTLLKNLIENAIQHSPKKGIINVLVSAAELMVVDQGSGVKPSELQKVFDRFWRGSHRRDYGSGLGLAICKEIAVAHGWSLIAENVQPGLRILIKRENS